MFEIGADRVDGVGYLKRTNHGFPEAEHRPNATRALALLGLQVTSLSSKVASDVDGTSSCATLPSAGAGSGLRLVRAQPVPLSLGTGSGADFGSGRYGHVADSARAEVIASTVIGVHAQVLLVEL